MSEQQDAPKIEFPCPDYMIKIIGKNDIGFRGFVIETVQQHAPDLELSKVKAADSSKGTFQSVTVYITATGEEQLKALHQDLMASGRVRMVI
ncbi:MAG: DUF493 family protein [Marinobacterium sp.]|nr:DUF493 family protein [Marinobacterium sp.]